MKTKSEAIKNRKDIKNVEKYLKLHSERNYAIWVLGMNSGLRVSDIVGLNVSDVVDKTHISIIEKKTGKTKSFFMNNKLKCVLREYTKNRSADEPLFIGKQGKRLNRSEVYRFIKHACKEVGIKSHVSTHTMRKSFGYHHYQQFKDAVILQKIFNHSSQRITLIYIGIEQDEIDWSYKNFEL
jgi:integrase